MLESSLSEASQDGSIGTLLAGVAEKVKAIETIVDENSSQIQMFQK